MRAVKKSKTNRLKTVRGTKGGRLRRSERCVTRVPSRCIYNAFIVKLERLWVRSLGVSAVGDELTNQEQLHATA